MTRINVGNIRHPDASADALQLTSGGDVQVIRALGLGGATYGTSGQVLTSGGASTAPSWTTISTSNLTRMTEVATTSGNEIDVTGIPSGVRKILISFDHVSSSATNRVRLQIGDSGGIEESGYDSGSSYQGSGGYPSMIEDTSGFMIKPLTGSDYEINGTLTLLNASGNKWVGSWVSYGGGFYCQFGGGTKTLSGELTQLRFENLGTDTFDLGNITVFYEV